MIPMSFTLNSITRVLPNLIICRNRFLRLLKAKTRPDGQYRWQGFHGTIPLVGASSFLTLKTTKVMAVCLILCLLPIAHPRMTDQCRLQVIRSKMVGGKTSLVRKQNVHLAGELYHKIHRNMRQPSVYFFANPTNTCLSVSGIN